jgi:ethanolamine utilization protein EutQ
MTAPSVFRIADIQDRIDNLPENGTYIKPFVTTAISESMAGGINCLNKISVPWDLTCDEMIYCLQGTFRLVVDEIGYELNPGDLMFVPKDNHVKYECDDKCVIFYLPTYPVSTPTKCPHPTSSEHKANHRNLPQRLGARRRRSQPQCYRGQLLLR